ncbi:MAG: methylated-DNA--[protein]-cysteine S-methyltransferase [Rhodospirillales bacterium]|nr:methylated-DNA--[protein]-cysteine S-methyltransferase [Rhodospirillales bacterium]
MTRQVCFAINAYEDRAPTLAELSSHMGISPSHLQRTFKKILGVSPREYAEATRLQRFKIAVRAGGNVANALYEAGFGSSSRLYESAKPRLGMTPASYGKGGKGAEIFFATDKCALGFLLIAATEHGVCQIAFGDTGPELVAELGSEFPLAKLRSDDAGLAPLCEVLKRQLDGNGDAAAHLPLDVRATAFQAKVWNYLRNIPLGETRSYSQIARDLEAPKSTRAVAGACAANPAAIVVPCHRAIGADGGLRGYRWGVQRKDELLASEKKRAAATKEKA